MQNNRKKHIKIDNSISSEEIFVWLNAVNSDDEEVIDQLMNDFDIKFVANEEKVGVPQ